MKNNVEETKQSFEYQWKNLPEGRWLLSDLFWKENVDKFIPQELGIPKEWFVGKKVLDAGCGNGRWSYGFLKLGCEVTAFDISPSGCNSTKKNTIEFGDKIKIFQADIFELDNKPLERNGFDLVFSWGVLHHTQDTFKAFKLLVPYVNIKGIMHVYIYGTRRMGIRRELTELVIYKLFGTLSFERRKKLSEIIGKLSRVSPHSVFDRYSPRLRNRHTPEEVKSWFEICGFEDIKRIYPAWCRYDTIDIHMNGILKEKSEIARGD